MRNILSTVGVLLLVLGAIWFLQGVNVLPGNFMTSQTRCGQSSAEAASQRAWRR